MDKSRLNLTLFKELEPLIVRWMNSSPIGIVGTLNRISTLFSKIFYIILGENQIIIQNYSLISTEGFLKQYKINKDEIPAFSKGVNSNLLDFLPDLTIYEKDDEYKRMYFQSFIDSVFSALCKELHISLKGKLLNQLDISFARLYEIKMIFELINKFVYHTIDSGFNFENLLRYGGIPGFFLNYINSNLREILIKSKIRRSFVPKNKEGCFFTPNWVTDYINSSVLYYWFLTNNKLPNISDISVGLGSFIEKFIDPEFISALSIDNQKKEEISQNIGNFIFGYDTNEDFIDILKINHGILRKTGYSAINNSNFIQKDTLMEESEKKYDIVVGNPPWGATIDKKKLKKKGNLKKFTTKQFDSYSIFTIRNILSLKKGGFLFLVLPETLLLNPNYSALREFILKKTKILEIIHLGEGIFDGVNMPSIILGLQKMTPTDNHKIKAIINISRKNKISLDKGEENLFSLIKSHDNNNLEIIERNQVSFLDNNEFNLDIFASDDDKELLSKIEKENCYKLKNLVNNSRGVELGKKGRIICCNHCNVWSPPPKWNIDKSGNKFSNCSICKNKIYFNSIKQKDEIIVQIRENDKKIEYKRILLGENINKYYISGNCFIKLGYRGIKYKSKTIYEKKKILIRKTSDEIDAVIDYNNNYTIQVVYQFSLKDEFIQYKFFLEYILGIITSDIFQFYYSKKYQYKGRKNFPHHIQSNILNLPIPKVNFDDVNSISYQNFIKIVYYSLNLMLLYQINNLGVINKKFKKELEDFEKFYRKINEINSNSNILNLFAFEIDKYEKMKKKEENLIQEINRNKNELDNSVKMIFKL